MTLAAGGADADRRRRRRPAPVPDGVMLCNGRGIHDTSTAELALTLVLASLRGVPRVRAGAGPARRGRRAGARRWPTSGCVLVGYGAIGEAIEARLAPFEVEVVRVARSARDGVHPIGELPALLPDADVVILVVPLTDETRGLVDAGFLAPDEGRRAAGQRRPRRRRRHRRPGRRAARRAGSRAALDVVDPEPLPADSPLWDAPGPAGLAARRRREQRDVAARAPAGPRPAAPLRRRRGALWNIMSGDY